MLHQHIMTCQCPVCKKLRSRKPIHNQDEFPTACDNIVKALCLVWVSAKPVAWRFYIGNFTDNAGPNLPFGHNEWSVWYKPHGLPKPTMERIKAPSWQTILLDRIIPRQLPVAEACHLLDRLIKRKALPKPHGKCVLEDYEWYCWYTGKDDLEGFAYLWVGPDEDTGCLQKGIGSTIKPPIIW